METRRGLNKLTRETVNNMTKEEWLNYDPFLKKCCADCFSLKPAINLWCTNQSAIKARGTSLPGVWGCTYWKPDWSQIPKKFWLPENLSEYGTNPPAKAHTQLARPESIKENIFKKKWEDIKWHLKSHKN